MGAEQCCSLQVGELIVSRALFAQWPGQGKDRCGLPGTLTGVNSFTESWEKADGAPTATCATQPALQTPLRGLLMVGCLPSLFAPTPYPKGSVCICKA